MTLIYILPTVPNHNEWKLCQFLHVVYYMPIIISRGAEGPGREILQRPPVCLSKLCRYVYHVLGVCCIVFDIDSP